VLDMICGKTVRVEQEDKISHQKIPTRAQLFVQRGNRRSGIGRQIMNILSEQSNVSRLLPNLQKIVCFLLRVVAHNLLYVVR
jgi:hypothetical protein